MVWTSEAIRFIVRFVVHLPRNFTHTLSKDGCDSMGNFGIYIRVFKKLHTNIERGCVCVCKAVKLKTKRIKMRVGENFTHTYMTP